MIRMATIVLSVVLAYALRVRWPAATISSISVRWPAMRRPTPAASTAAAPLSRGCMSPPPPLLTCFFIPAAPRVA